MDKYFLNESKLNAVCLFHHLERLSPKIALASRINEIDKRVIKDLLIKQPELDPLEKEFLKEIDSPKLANLLFSKKFDGKIEISNFTHQLFTKAPGFDATPYRVKIFKEILNEYPPVLKLVHQKKKQSPVKNDLILFDFYFTALKDKKTDRKSLGDKEVLDNIDSFSPEFDFLSQKKKINAYLNNFPKDLILYDHIMEQMGEFIRKSAVMKIFWEEKITKFPKEIQQKYQQENIVITPWVQESNYYYKFKINPQYVIEKGNVPQSKAENFCRVLHNAIGDFVSDEFKTSIQIRENSNNSVSFNFDSQQERDDVENFCKSIGHDIDSLIKSFNHNDSYHNQSLQIDNYLDKLYLATSLNKELSIKNSPTSVTKRKI
jgi:hypothetical protein